MATFLNNGSFLNKTNKKDTEEDKPPQPIQSRVREGKLAGTLLHSNKRASEEEVWFNNPAPATTMSAGPQP